jgi:hypothetical protein
MPPKGAKPTNDELLAQFDLDNLGVDQPKSAKPTAPADNAKSQEDVLAELDNLSIQRPSSGPGTPRLSADKPRSSTRSPRPSATIERTEEKAPRQSEDTSRSSHTGLKQEPKVDENTAPQPQHEKEQPQQGQGGGWWGGIFATASAAMKQAEAAVKEIQNNEEAQRWAQQVKGNVGALRDFGMWFMLTRSLFLFTFDLALLQVARFATWPSRPSQTSFTPSPLPFHRTNVFRSM